MNYKVIPLLNEKVLLRERKRHTNPRVSSTPSVNRSGVPPIWYPLPVGYPPQPGLTGGTRGWVPPIRYPPWQGPMGGYPTLGTIPHRVPQPGLMGVPKLGYPPVRYPCWVPHPPPHLDLAGYPPPPGPGSGTPRRCGETDGQTRAKTLPSRHTTYVVGKKTDLAVSCDTLRIPTALRTSEARLGCQQKAHTK